MYAPLSWLKLRTMTEGPPSSRFYTDGGAVAFIHPEEKDEIKPGVTLDPDLRFLIPAARPSDSDPRLLTVHQGLPLRVALEEVCRAWHLSDPDAFAFIIGPDCFAAPENQCAFLTQEVKTGQAIVDALDGDEVGRLREALKLIKVRSGDGVFAESVLGQGALERVMGMVEAQTCLGQNDVPNLLLEALVALMEAPGPGRWAAVREPLLSEVYAMITGQSKTESSDLICSALNVLELVLSNSPEHYPLIREKVEFAALIRHLDHSSQEIQRNTLALMNALYRRAEGPLLAHISDQVRGKPVRNAILGNIISGRGGTSLGSELSHQLGVLQRLFFNRHYGAVLAARPISAAAASADLETLNAIRAAVFDPIWASGAMSPTAARKAAAAQLSAQFAQLGFPSPSNPAADFAAVPPGVLPLHCLATFVADSREEAHRMVLEAAADATRAPPLALLAIHLTTLLADVLAIYKPPLEAGHPFHELFFESEVPFERLFCVVMVALRRDWRDMSASVSDIEKVLRVVRAQVETGLASSPKTFAELAGTLARQPYAEVKRAWDVGRAAAEGQASARQPIRELRAALRAELVGLVSAQRLGVLRRGLCFPKYASGERSAGREKGRFVWWALDASGSALLYRATEREAPIPAAFEETASRLPVSELAGVVEGRDCPHVKEAKKRAALDPQAAFSVLVNSEDQCLNFLAPDMHTAQLWTDGLRALMGLEPTSTLAAEELKALLDMEIRIRLLDLDGAVIPDANPLIPPPPPDLTFVY